MSLQINGSLSVTHPFGTVHLAPDKFLHRTIPINSQCRPVPQIEAARIAMTRYIKRGGQVWIKIFPDMPVTKKPMGTRMGSGKGAPEYWVAVVKPGRVMFEIAGVSEEVAREAMRLAMHKLPIKCKFVMKKEEGGEQ